jgi:hypothetical protein
MNQPPGESRAAATTATVIHSKTIAEIVAEFLARQSPRFLALFGPKMESRNKLSPRQYRMVDPNHDYGADDRHEHAPKVEARDAVSAQRSEQKSTDKRADDSERDVNQESLAGVADDFAANEACDEAQNKPAENSHGVPSQFFGSSA